MVALALTSKEKDRILRTLEEDREFRLAIAGLVGMREILERMDRTEENIEKLWEEVKQLRLGQEKLWEEVKQLWEEVKQLRLGQEKLWEEVKQLRLGQEKLWEEV
ncbi:MAG: hypothetical protein DRN81_06680, partial [Thermoproteota archaeon]